MNTTTADNTDQSPATFSKLGIQARQRRIDAFRRVADAARRHRDLPDGLTDVEVVNLVADEIERGA